MLVLLQHLMGSQVALDYLGKLQANNVGPSSSTGKLQPKVSNGELLVANGDVQMNLGSIKDDGSKFNDLLPRRRRRQAHHGVAALRRRRDQGRPARRQRPRSCWTS